MRLRTLAVPLALAGALYAQAPRTANQLVPSEQLNAELPAWLRFSGNYQVAAVVLVSAWKDTPAADTRTTAATLTF